MNEPNMSAGWTADADCHVDGKDYNYLRLVLRWTQELHDELGCPAFASVTIKPCPSGDVLALVVPAATTKRGSAWAVKPKRVHDIDWYQVTANIRPDQREDAKYLPGHCSQQPAEGWVANGLLACKVVEAVPVADEGTADEATPGATGGAVLPFDEADDQTPTTTSPSTHLRPAWAHVRLLQKELARVEGEREELRKHRETVLARDAQTIRSTEEFRAQVLQHSNRQTTALESIATSLKNMGTATGPTYAAIKALVYIVAKATGAEGYAKAYQDIRDERGGTDAETPETEDQD